MFDRQQRGRASMSFASDEIEWLYAVLLATMTGDRHRLVELRSFAVGQRVLRKAQTLRRKAAEDAQMRIESKAETRQRKLAEDVLNGAEVAQ